MDDIKAIETSYKGYRFRSRLEARWAVFLDALEVPWEYEKQGYIVDGTPYLPDFWVPQWRADCNDAGCWIEIKPTNPTQQEIDLLAGLVKMTGHRGYLIAGNPWPEEHTISVFQHHRDGEPESVPIVQGELVLEGEASVLPLWDYGNGKEIGDGDAEWWFALQVHQYRERKDDPLRIRKFPFIRACDSNGHSRFRRLHLTKAFRAARAARFEHGEKPRV